MKINSYPNPFIAIEGIDGCGKSTLIEGIKRWDKKHKFGSIFTKEPTDGKFGQLIRKILENDGCDEKGQKVKPMELQMLYIKDRYEHRKTEATFLEMYPVISDRDFPSTLSYGIAEGLDPQWILSAHELILGDYFFVPDLILILDLPAEEAIERLKKTHKQPDYFEKLAFLKKIRESYLAFSMAMGKLPVGMGKINIQIINAMPSPAKILKTALPFIEAVFRKKGER